MTFMDKCDTQIAIEMMRQFVDNVDWYYNVKIVLKAIVNSQSMGALDPTAG